MPWQSLEITAGEDVAESISDALMELGALSVSIEDADAETGLTECPTCSMQMEHGTGYEIRHTLEVLEAALVGEEGETE